MHYRRWHLLLLALVLVAGCSALRIGYRHADTYLAWRADEYLDFNPQQKHEFNERLDRLLAWHRYEELPEYASFVSAAIAKGQGGLKREDMMWFVEGIKARYRRIVDHGAADAADILATVSDEQLVTLQKQWDKDNRKFIRERALDRSIADRKRERLKRALAEIKDWAGHLTDEQEEKIEALQQSVPYVNHLRYRDRVRRQMEFLELLKLRARPEFSGRLHAWLLDWESGRAPEYAKLMHEVYEGRMEFYIGVEKILTPEQRTHAWHKLGEYVDDFRALSRKPAAAGIAPVKAARLALFCLPALDACLPE